MTTSASTSGLIEGTTSLLRSEKYSDLTITTTARSFKLHKAIVCTQSKVLAAMSDSGFKESSTSTLVLEDDDPATVERMVNFFYTGTYDDGNPTTSMFEALDPGVAGTILMANTLVYALAEKYDIGRLKEFACAKFRNVHVYDAWKSKDFAKVVLEIFESTPERDLGLRGVVSNICASHIDDILASESWNRLLVENGAIGLSIFKVVLEMGKANYEVVEKELNDVTNELFSVEEQLAGY